MEQFGQGYDFKVNMNELIVGPQIGSGASANVYKGTYKELDVAIKKLRFAPFDPNDFNPSAENQTQNSLKEFQREVTTLYKIRHPNLVMFQGACADKGHIVILTEFCSGGSLFTLLHEKKSIPLSWKQKHRMALDIAQGMNYLHT
jgi:serine/threonine protein kinase